MRTIEEAAQDCAIGSSFLLDFPHHTESVEYGFKECAKFMQRWISVEEELPENDGIVLVKTDNGSITIAYLHGKKSGFITYGEEAYKVFGDITHWRPINFK